MMSRAVAFSLLAVLSALGSGACAGAASLEGRPCPCAAGWACCAALNLCVEVGAACPADPTKQDAGLLEADASPRDAAADAALPDASPRDVFVPEAPDATSTDAALDVAPDAARDAATDAASTADVRAPDASEEACVPESDSVLRAANCAEGACGTRTLRDACGAQRTIDCGNTCNTPPASACADAFTRRTFEPTGTCVAGRCTYAVTERACAAPMCVNGQSVSAGTCSGAGVCAPGTATSCANGCAGNACAGDPCAGVTCVTPPGPTCANGITRRAYASTGICVNGTCTYGGTDTACAPASCTNGVATTAASCAGGACQAGSQTTCAFGCNGARCAADPCAGVTCATPPGPTCANGTTRRTYASSGTCTNGTCSYTPTDTACPGTQTCSGGLCSGPSGSELSATSASLSGPGLSDCGPSGNDVCARSLLVTGGTFYRGTDTASPATVSDFRLDKYEVTVARFGKFADAWTAGWRPAAGSGKHAHLNGGAGLVNAAGGKEPGWDSAWTAYVGAPKQDALAPTGAGAVLRVDFDYNLNCGGSFSTSNEPAKNAKRPQNCLSWYDLHAFCIWDGGFLPSEAEWEYAAAGGSEERKYPWGNTAPAANASQAVYGCYFNGTGSCTGTTNIAPVGSVAAGAGRWGQLDLAGSGYEWGLDWYNTPYVAPCDNCTNLVVGTSRALRGGSFKNAASTLPSAGREYGPPASRYETVAGRCARAP